MLMDDFGIRRITPDECLALMGFPEDFGFPKDLKESSAYKQSRQFGLCARCEKDCGTHN